MYTYRLHIGFFHAKTANTLHLFLTVALLAFCTQAFSAQSDFGTTSVLATGKWVKIKTTAEGIHQIPYSTLANWGFNDPQKLSVYGNGGRLLPKSNSAIRYDDLIPNRILHTGNSILFYAQSCNSWTYDPSKDFFENNLHDFEQATYFFLTDSQIPVGEPEILTPNNLQVTKVLTNFRFHIHYEQELNNLLRSGRRWLGERFDTYTPIREFTFTIPDLDNRNKINYKIKVAARSNTTSNFQITNLEGASIGQIALAPVSFSNYEGIFASESTAFLSTEAGNEHLGVRLQATLGSNTAQGWLDYITLNAYANLNMQGKSQLQFRSPETLIGPMGEATQFNLSNASANSIIWETSTPGNPVQIPSVAVENSLQVIVPNGKLHELICFQPNGSFPQPQFVENIKNQNLHACEPVEYIIVAHPLFQAEAERLADLHRTHKQLSAIVVTTDQIFNEFSSGSRDVSAIRDFIRMHYTRSSNNSPVRLKYVLLFGDGSYDNRTLSEENPAYIPTYQSETSFHQAETYVTDDYFGFLDAHEGENDLSGRLDIGIGRFPASTIAQAAALVDKSEKYLIGSHQGQWKNQITFLADDGDGNVHMSQSNQLADKVLKSNPEFHAQKVYFDAYKPVIGTSGKTFPEINTLINRSMQQGTLLFNYTGHGSEKGLAHERVVSVGDIQSWTNFDRMPLFVTATCEFSRFDNKSEISAGEWVLLNNKGGGIALFTTTRLVYSAPNFTINSNFYNYIFQKNEEGHPLAFGEVMRRTKTQSGGNINTLNFTLLGDPALSLNYPDLNISTDSINGQPFTTYADPLRAMTRNSMSGSIRNAEGAIQSNFSGEVSITLYDKPSAVKTLGNEGTPFGYNVYQNILYSGKAAINAGHFEFTFMVPKDIRYNVDFGKISYYATSTDSLEAIGASTQIRIGESSDKPVTDFSGPIIEMGLNDEDFQSGQRIGSKPILWARLSDESGINTSGIGIGHDITLTLNGDREQQVVLNPFYQSNVDTYQSGKISYSLPELSEGNYSLELKAWDNLNNSSVASIHFKVTNSNTLEIKHTKLFPNPAQKGEPVYLSFAHNDPDSWLIIRLTITSIDGRRQQLVTTESVSNGTTATPLPLHTLFPIWNQLTQGVYIITTEIETTRGKQGKFSEKIIIIP